MIFLKRKILECDCEADLSMGTVCDVNTGQCHCQEGAIGPRCDQCAPQYLRIPNLGCRCELLQSLFPEKIGINKILDVYIVSYPLTSCGSE